jgi:sugar phosphate isomerase/epimerase
LHGCFEGCPKSLRGYYLNLAEQSPDTYAAIRAQIDLASEIGQENPILVFHPGYCEKNSSREQALKNVINNIQPHLDYAAEKNVIMTLENMDYKPEGNMIFYDHQDFEYLYKYIDHPNLKTTFDWGHMNTNSQNPEVIKRIGKDRIKGFEHISEFIEKLNNKIIHAHMHYNKSHQLGGLKKKRNYINDAIYLIFFWTETVKFLNQGNVGISVYDKHLPFNRISAEYTDSYRKTVRELLEKTSISEFGRITHEISPKKIFKYFNFIEEGAEYEDLTESLKLFKAYCGQNQ